MGPKRKKTNPNKRISSLPVEIWRECFLYLAHKDHKQLWRTCRLFRDICFPLMMHSISCSCRLHVLKGADRETLHKDISKALRHVGRLVDLVKNSQHAAYVRRLKLQSDFRLSKLVDSSSSEHPIQVYDAFHSALSTCVPALSNLQEVQIDFRDAIKKPTLAMLASLPRLDHLHFTMSKFGLQRLTPRLRARRLSIDNRYEDEPSPSHTKGRLDIFSGDLLEMLSVLSGTYAPKILKALKEQGPSGTLKTLSVIIKPEDLSILYGFLTGCPNLESINIEFPRYIARVPEALPVLLPSAVPSLKRLFAPDGLLRSFICGRPIATLRLPRHIDGWPFDRDLEDLRDIFAYCLLGTATITDLDLGMAPFGPDLFDQVVSSFPHLKRLGWAVSRATLVPKDIFLRFASATKPSKKRKGKQEVKLLLPSTYNIEANYLDTLLCLSLMKISLPSTLEVLFLEEIIIPGNCGPDFDDDSEIGGTTCIEATEGPIHCDGRSYTVDMVLAIFSLISDEYPNLKRIVVGESETAELTWTKGPDDKWSWYGWVSL